MRKLKFYVQWSVFVATLLICSLTKLIVAITGIKVGMVR